MRGGIWDGPDLSHGVCRTNMGNLCKFLATFYSNLPFGHRENKPWRRPLTSTYQLLTNHFRECCYVSLLGQTHNNHGASTIVLLDSPTLPFVNCSKPNITTPYLSHLSLLGITVCFNSSGTLFVGTLDSADFTLTLSTATQSLCPNSHNASIFCSTQVYLCLPTGKSVTCPRCSFFQN